MAYQQLWQRYRNLRFENLPDDVAEVANQCILDWYGCALAGSREPLAGILRDHFSYRSGQCRVIGSDLALDAPTAALVNGASGHALDFDDTGSRTMCHTTAPVLPAVLAVACELDSTGEALTTAFVAGVEIAGRIAQVMGSDHYARGWHTTATYGTFGATAAVAHLLQLDDETFATAMGLAASHAGGVKANFGTMTKPYHPGHAAECGVNSARLAAAGFTANPDAVLGNQGFVRAASNAAHPDEDFELLDGEWLILGTLFKFHAACHLTHAGIESIASLMAEHDPEKLSALTITVNPGLLDVCGIETPTTGLEGKFSLRGTAAMTLNGIDTATPASFVDSVIAGDQVQSLLPKITVETDRALTQFQTRIQWVDDAQARHEAFRDLSEPASDYPEQRRKLEAKFASLREYSAVGEGGLAETINQLATAQTVNL